MAEQKGHYSDE